MNLYDWGVHSDIATKPRSRGDEPTVTRLPTVFENKTPLTRG